ncbi:MAG: sigma-70 family RNA polymerase sigma factor [Rhodospirillaceae bacterium]|nr:sigma-70 family RNA polymerase sigma factor [Rhodospirillaceae bacterium]
MMAAINKTSSFTEADLLACLSPLRAYATFLTRDRIYADDLVQDTIVRALTAAHQFQLGTNLKAWLSTILRYQYYSQIRRNQARVRTVSDTLCLEASVPPSQEASLEFADFCRACWQLSPDQREALILVGASGFSYEEAASVCACPVGTIKSRVSRARLELQRLLLDGALPGNRRDLPVLSPDRTPLESWYASLPAALSQQDKAAERILVKA